MADQEKPEEPAEPSASQGVAETSTPIDDAHGQTPAEQLAEMEAHIRKQLQAIVRRAKQAETDARALIGRVKLMLRTRKAIIALTDPENQHVARLSAAAYRVSQKTAHSLRQVTNQIERDVALRHEIGTGSSHTWRQFEGVVFASTEAWFRAVASRHSGTRKQLDQLRTRIRRGEKRWHSKTRSAKHPPKSGGKKASPVDTATDTLISAKRIDD